MSIANELIVRGWHQGRSEGPDKSVCLLGAVGCALRGSAYMWPEVEELDRLFPSLGDHWVDISRWNDNPARTFDEVLRTARLADEILDAERDA